jgi:hypothetical protein
VDKISGRLINEKTGESVCHLFCPPRVTPYIGITARHDNGSLSIKSLGPS